MKGFFFLFFFSRKNPERPCKNVPTVTARVVAFAHGNVPFGDECRRRSHRGGDTIVSYGVADEGSSVFSRTSPSKSLGRTENVRRIITTTLRVPRDDLCRRGVTFYQGEHIARGREGGDKMSRYGLGEVVNSLPESHRKNETSPETILQVCIVVVPNVFPGKRI